MNERCPNYSQKFSINSNLKAVVTASLAVTLGFGLFGASHAYANSLKDLFEKEGPLTGIEIKDSDSTESDVISPDLFDQIITDFTKDDAVDAKPAEDSKPVTSENNGEIGDLLKDPNIKNYWDTPGPMEQTNLNNEDEKDVISPEYIKDIIDSFDPENPVKEDQGKDEEPVKEGSNDLIKDEAEKDGVIEGVNPNEGQDEVGTTSKENSSDSKSSDQKAGTSTSSVAALPNTSDVVSVALCCSYCSCWGRCAYSWSS